MPILALIFDFDGLILDTETPDVRAWQDIYTGYGLTFPVESWGQIIGGTGAAKFDAALHLQSLSGRSLDVEALRSRQNHISYQLVLQQPALPGVLDVIQQARGKGLRLAIASSSEHAWVDTHLKRLNLIRYFDPIICAEDVLPGRVKPHPDLFQKVLHELHLLPEQALVFEDSPNGVRAAKSAGIFTVAVPNPTTALLKIEGADLVLTSLADFKLQKLIG